MHISDGFLYTCINDEKNNKQQSDQCKTNEIHSMDGAIIKTPFKLNDMSLLVFIDIMRCGTYIEKTENGKLHSIELNQYFVQRDFCGGVVLCFLQLIDFFQVTNTFLLFDYLDRFHLESFFNVNIQKIMNKTWDKTKNDVKYSEYYEKLLQEKFKEKQQSFDLKFLSFCHLFHDILYDDESRFENNFYYKMYGGSYYKFCRNDISQRKQIKDDNINNKKGFKPMVEKFLKYTKYLLKTYPDKCVGIIPKLHLWEYPVKQLVNLNIFKNFESCHIDDISAPYKETQILYIDYMFSNLKVIIEWNWANWTSIPNNIYKTDIFYLLYVCSVDNRIHKLNINVTKDDESIIIKYMNDYYKKQGLPFS
jgi:hypothetical protein